MLETLPKLEHFDHVHIFVADRVAAEAWYQRVLGFHRITELESWAKNGGPLTLANDNAHIHLALFERPAGKNHSVVALRASAIEFLRWKAHLTTTLSRTIDAVDHQFAWSLYFSDPDGNPFEITSYQYDEISRTMTTEISQK
jgi:catechol-2,3-dioxygenase